MPTISQLQSFVGAKPDGAWGPKSQLALDAILHPAIPAPVVPAVAFSGDKVDERSERAISSLLPVVQPKAREFIRQLNEKGIKAKIISGSRTFAEQDGLYAQGRTKPGNIVTNARGGYSWHNYSVAFDIGIFTDAGYLDDSPLYRQAGPIGEALGFEWGGRWRGSLVDEPHYQYNPHGITLAEAKSMYEQGKAIA